MPYAPQGGALAAHASTHELLAVDLLKDFNYQTYSIFFDDFVGNALRPEFTRYDSNGTGVGPTLQDVSNGTVRVTSGAVAANRSWLWFNKSPYVVRSTESLLLMRVAFVAVTSVYCAALLCAPAGSENKILFCLDTTVSVNIYTKTILGGVITSTDTGVVADTSLHNLITLYKTGQVKFYIDGVLKTTHTTNIPTVGMCPTLDVQTNEAVAKSIDMDVCYVRQSRA